MPSKNPRVGENSKEMNNMSVLYVCGKGYCDGDANNNNFEEKCWRLCGWSWRCRVVEC